MPAEIRYIAFPPVEVVSAIIQYRVHCRDPVPRGGIIGFDIAGSPCIEANVRLLDEESGAEKTIRVQSERLAASLVLYCIQSKVPIPAKAHKLLYVGRDGGVVMAYALNLDPSGREMFASTTPPVFVEPPPRHGPASLDPDGVIRIEDEFGAAV